jgi:hypothetical protein
MSAHVQLYTTLASIDLFRGNGQVSSDHQPPDMGAVLGSIPPWRSICASTAFAQLNGGVLARLGTRF